IRSAPLNTGFPVFPAALQKRYSSSHSERMELAMTFQTVKIRRMTVTASVILFSLVATLGVAQTTQNNSTWQLVWSDEFNGAAGSLPDANKWTYDVGGGGWGNNEEEYYCVAGSNAYPCNSATPNAVMDG